MDRAVESRESSSLFHTVLPRLTEYIHADLLQEHFPDFLSPLSGYSRHRALIGDKPLTDFITIYCCLVFDFEFYFFGGIAQKLPLCVQLGQPSYNVP
jgi:hypothetical protein